MAVRISEDGNTTENKYLYQGKELNQTENLNIYDFHTRQYDPLLGRFTAVDPAGQFASGYVGMANNPTTYVDPTGMVAFGSSAQEARWEMNRQIHRQKREHDYFTSGTIDPWDPNRHEMRLTLLGGAGAASNEVDLTNFAETVAWVEGMLEESTKANLIMDLETTLEKRGENGLTEQLKGMTVEKLSELKDYLKENGEEGEAKTGEDELNDIQQEALEYWNSLAPKEKYNQLKEAGYTDMVVKQGARRNKDGSKNELAHRDGHWIETYSIVTINKNGQLGFFQPKQLPQHLNGVDYILPEVVDDMLSQIRGMGQAPIAVWHTHLISGFFSAADNNFGYERNLDLFMFAYPTNEFYYLRAVKELHPRFNITNQTQTTLGNYLKD